MDHLWSNFLPILILVAGLASSDHEVLVGKPFNASTSRPNSWLRIDKIRVNEAKRLNVTVRYFIVDCSSIGEKGENKCVNAIDLYVKQSNQDIIDKSNYPNPLSHTTSYEKIAELGHPTNVETSKTVSVVIKRKFLFLAFHNNGACSILYSVNVSYNFCPEKILGNNLLVLPRTAAPANELEISRVEGRCKENAVQFLSSLHAYCDSRGSWNKTSFEGRCICKEDMENTDGRCQDSKAVIYLNIIYGFVVLLVLFIVGSVCFIIYRRCRHQRNRDCFEEPETAEPTGTMSLEPGKAESTGAMRVEPEKAESLISAYDNVALWTVAEGQNEDGIRLIRDQIKTIRFLGNGNFGQVYHAVYGPLRTEVAVKSLRDDATKKDLKDILTELDLMKSLKPHPHVVRLIGCCTEKEPIMIVLEYLPYGDLLGYLRKSRGIEDTYNSGEKRPSSTLTEKDLLSFAWMIADGMSYLSTMKVVHRDLAARNVLVGDNKVCKISDFGLARGLEGDVYMRKAKARLPIKWMPPESILYGTSTTMSDVWSYGIVMWEVFTIGESPYPGKTKSEIAGLLVKGYRMPKPAHISQELYSIMTKCWEEKPQERPTFQWLCSTVKKLLHDRKNHVNLEVYDTKDYVNFDMMAGKDREEETASNHDD